MAVPLALIGSAALGGAARFGGRAIRATGRFFRRPAVRTVGLAGAGGAAFGFAESRFDGRGGGGGGSSGPIGGTVLARSHGIMLVQTNDGRIVGVKLRQRRKMSSRPRTTQMDKFLQLALLKKLAE